MYTNRAGVDPATKRKIYLKHFSKRRLINGDKNNSCMIQKVRGNFYFATDFDRADPVIFTLSSCRLHDTGVKGQP